MTWGAIIGLGSLALNWSAASNAEQAAREQFAWQKQMAQNAINAVQQDQKLWDSVVPELQEKLIRYTTGNWNAGEAAAREAGIVNRAAPAITQAAGAINQQAAASKRSLSSSLGSRGLTQFSPGIARRSLTDLETARTGTIGEVTASGLNQATVQQDQLAVNGLNTAISRYGARPSLAGAYGSASGLNYNVPSVGVDASILGEMADQGGEIDIAGALSRIRGMFRNNKVI